MTQVVHVVSWFGKWSVRRSGATRASSRHPDQASAVRAAEAMLHDGGVLFLHGTDGRVAERREIAVHEPPTKLVTLAEAADICALAGLSDLDLRYWQNQTDRGQVPCSVVANRKRVRRDYVEQLVDRAVRDATAPSQGFVRWLDRQGRKSALALIERRHAEQHQGA